MNFPDLLWQKKAGSGVVCGSTARHSPNHHKRKAVYAFRCYAAMNLKTISLMLGDSHVGCCARAATVPATLPCGKLALSRGSTGPRTGGRNRARTAHELPLALSFRHKAAGRHQEISR